MSAAERLSQLDQLNAKELCGKTVTALDALLDVMNEETMLLRAGELKKASILTPKKSQMSQDYVTLARAVKREAGRLKLEAPIEISQLKKRHESLATQMAENLRVLACAKNVAQDLLTDVAKSMGANSKPKTYGAGAKLTSDNAAPLSGLSLDRAL